MKVTLTSMNPPHTTNVFEGRKTIEWRTFPMPQGLHYVYETKRCFGQGLVIGSIEISRWDSFYDVDEIPNYMIIAGCVPRDFLKAYAKGRKLYANIISDRKLFDAPKRINCFTNYSTRQLITRAPQSYMYIEV